MPTLKARHMVTENAEISSALDRAALLWPELTEERSALLRKVIATGIAAMDASAEMRRAQRLDAIKRIPGSMPAGMWDGFREQQLADWPE